MLLAVACVLALAVGAYLLLKKPQGKNPFDVDHRRPLDTRVLDQEIRNKRLKQGYRKDHVPDNLDAIVIGSGMGGLCSAVLLAQAGKRVLVLEQHDQAGGSMHAFIEKGIEHSAGIHYIGELKNNSITRFLFEQITEGQLEWAHLDEEYDEVVLGETDSKLKRVPIMSGRKPFADALKKEFPNEHAAIDKFMALLKKQRSAMLGFVTFKFLPLWLTNFLTSTGLVHLYTDFFKYSKKTVKEVLDSLTNDQDLKAVLAYSFGDYGTPPSKAPFTMQAALQNHFMNGGSYPVGGSSEVAYTMIPVIEKSGGKVMVRAAVHEIIQENGRAVGVTVGRNKDVIKAPIIISSAGIINTLKFLNQPEVHSLPAWGLKNVEAGTAAMCAFIALKDTNEANKLPRKNFWVFRNSDLDGSFEKYMKLSREEAAFDEEHAVPLMFLSFPSTKDPTWDERFPGRSAAEIVTLAPFEWFEQWEDERVMKRGQDYDALKAAFGRKLVSQMVELFPELEDKIESVEVGTALSNQYYLGTSRGEIYGLDHTTSRFSPENTARLRPETSVPGLYLTGQDIFSCGIVGAMFSGLLTSSTVLNRNLFIDTISARSKFNKTTAKAKAH